MPILREDILAPIPGDNPSGINLYYDPIMDKIKEARREDENIPSGEWERELKVADHKLVIKLGSETIATKSKDLQIAAWVTESLLKNNGYPGLKEGLDLLKGLIEIFWDTCYPEIEDGDLELRLTPLDFVGMRLEVPMRLTPVLKNGYNTLQYAEARRIPTEGEVADNEEKTKVRQQAIADGKITPEEWEIADKATPNEFLINLAAVLDGCIESTAALGTVADEKFGSNGPNLGPLRTTLTEIRHTVKLFLKNRGVTDGPAGAEDAAEPGAETAGDGMMVVGGGPRGISVTGAIPQSMEEIPIRVDAIAKFLREKDPASPGAYLMLRGLRWGELRGLGANPDQRDLPAPSTELRMAVKRAFLNEDWAGCLAASEAVMADPGGRAWLDVHRYTVKAAENLGYDLIANAVKNELRSLLADMPELPKLQLLDDSPAANGKTREWIEELLAEQPVAPRIVPELPPEPPPRTGRDPFDTAKEHLKAGNVAPALRTLKEQLNKEVTGRGKFERKLQLAWILLESNNDLMAQTYVDECVAQIEGHKLDEWESGAWLAELMVTCLNCLNRREADYELRTKLYRTIARLDPAKALSCSV
jgi:type VI secretion system protein ImpA